MQLNGSMGGVHLTYCTNIHAAESWPEVIAGLRRHVADIKSEVSPDARFGIGLRLAASAAEALADDGCLAELIAFLDDNDCYVFTINGFPYGVFHGQPVKDGAYRPDWTDPARVRYTNQLADILAKLLPSDTNGSVSTVPGTFKGWVDDTSRVSEVISENILQHVAHLVALHQTNGTTLALALEPEPFCLLETIQETVDFFQRYLYADAAVERLQALTGLNASAATDALHTHLGVCYDVCHAAVEFEGAKDSIEQLNRSGIPIAKLQISSALRIRGIDSDRLEKISAFDEPVYLHQVVAQHNGELVRYVDLDDAIRAVRPALANAGGLLDTEWRVHFHVPIFLDELKDFGTTQHFLREILQLHQAAPISQHLEVETYTWDVLPDEYRNVDVSSAIAREINWVKSQLGA